jgi:predicted outer membrane repeat protein
VNKLASIASALALVGALLAGAPAAVRASGTTYYVGPNTHVSGGSCADPDYTVDGTADDVQVQLAFDAASDGDTVHLCAGTYRFADEVWWNNAGVITVEGDGIAASVVDGQDTTRLFNSFHDLTLRLLTLQNANYGSGQTCMVEYGDGGAVCTSGVLTLASTLFQHNHSAEWAGAAAAGEVHIVDSVFIDNHSAGTCCYGGAVVTEDLVDAHSTIDASRFENNVGGNGGAVFTSFRDSVTVTNSVFIGNHAVNHNGGALCVEGHATVSNSRFNENTATWGGAIGCGGMSLAITSSVFTGNTAGQRGGAIDARESNGTTIVDSVFGANVATIEGGAIGARYSDLVVRSSQFTSNISGTYGGAIWSQNHVLDVTRTRFIRNRASGDGGAIWVRGYAASRKNLQVLVARNTFAGNRGKRWADVGGSLQ